MSKYQAYPQYKDSGFGWLGNVPTHWVVSPIKWQIEKVSGGAWGQDPNGVEDTFVLRSTEQTHDGEWKIEDPASRRLSPQEAESTLLKEDDLLMTKSSGSSLHIGKTTIVTGEIAKLRCGYSNFMQRIRIKEDYIARFYWYIFNNELARKQLDYLSSSTTGLANLNATVIGEIICSNPPKVEQEKIVYFLDHETAKIDTLIDKQQQLIQLLKEKRQAVISHAVTKGLNPNAPMRDSGVEWLGEVPEHWKVAKVKYFATVQGGYAFNSDTYRDNGVQLLRIGNVYLNRLALERQPTFVDEQFVNMHPHFVIRKGDILMSLTGTLGKTDYGYAVHVDEKGPFMLNQRVAKIMPRGSKIAADYLIYAIRSDSYLTQLYSLPSGTKQANLSNDDVINIPIVVPPTIEEQLLVAQYISDALGKYDYLISKSEAAISLIQERRTALISAAVTGKIDVRHHVSRPTGNDTSEVSA